MAGMIAKVYTDIVKLFQEPLAKNAETIGNAVMPVFGAVFLLYMIYIVYRMYSKKDALFEEFMNYLILFAIVGVFIAASGKYYSGVIPFVTNAGDEIANSLTGAADTSTSAVDTVYNAFQAGIDKIKEAWDKQGWWDKITGTSVDVIIKLFFLYLAQFIFTIVISVNLLIAKVMVTLLLSVGIIFIAFSIFPATRNMFYSFMGLCFNYILLNIMYSLAAKLASDYIMSTLNGSDIGLAAVAAAAQVLITTVIIILAINQIPVLVSTLTGGVGISAFTISSSSFSKMGGAIGKILGKGAGGAGKGLFTAGNYASKGGLGRGVDRAKQWKSRAVNAVKSNYNKRIGKGTSGNS